MADEKVEQLQLMLLETSRTISEQKKLIRTLTAPSASDKIASLVAEIRNTSFAKFNSGEYCCVMYEKPSEEKGERYLDKFYTALTINKFSVMHMGIDARILERAYQCDPKERSLMVAPIREIDDYDMENIKRGHIVVVCTSAYIRAYCVEEVFQRLLKAGLFDASCVAA